MDSREKILSKIKKALEKETSKPISKPNLEADVYLRIEEDLTVLFAENFSKNGGELFYCPNLEDFLLNLRQWLDEKGILQNHIYVWEEYLQKLLDIIELGYNTTEKDLENIKIGITLCEALVARTGSILVSSQQSAGRRLTIFPPIHIVLAFTSQIFKGVKETMTWVKETKQDNFPSMLSLVSGPSRTADIEKKLVLGMHGPEKLLLFLIEDSEEI